MRTKKSTKKVERVGSLVSWPAATLLPGIDNSQVIASQPLIVSMTTSKPQDREIKVEQD